MSRKGQITITSVSNIAKYFFKNSSGSYVASGIPNTELNPSDNSTYGFNSLLAPAAFKIQYNDIPFIELTSVTNSTTNTQDNTLRFYSSSTSTTGPRAMELTNSELAFYNIDSSNDKVASLSTNGLILTSGGITAGNAGQNGYVYLSSEDNTNSITINGHTPTQNDPKWRQVIGTKFGVDSEGNLYANSANISGVITISSGSNVYTKTEADTAFDVSGAAATAEQNAISSANSYTDTATQDMATTADIPTKVSDLDNDSEFQTQNQVESAISTGIGQATVNDLSDGSNYSTTADMNTAISTATNDMATQTYVTSQGYQNATQVSGAVTTGIANASVSDLSDGANYSTTAAMNTAISTATSNLAAKTTAVKRSQVIYYRTNQIPSSWDLPTTWIASASDTVDSWTTQVPSLANSTSIGATPYPYLYTITQIEYNDDNHIGYSSETPSLDNTTTVIDGGKIITNSVTAEKIYVTDLNALNATIGNISISSHNLNISEDYQDTTHGISHTTVERFGLGRDADDSSVYYIKMGATPTSVKQNDDTYAAEAPNIFYVNSNGILNIGKDSKGIRYNFEEDELNINVSNITLGSGNNLEDEVAQIVDAAIDDTLLYDAVVCFSTTDELPQNPEWQPYTVTQETSESLYDLSPANTDNTEQNYSDIEFVLTMANTGLYYGAPTDIEYPNKYYFYGKDENDNVTRISWENNPDTIFGNIQTEYTIAAQGATDGNVETTYNNLIIHTPDIYARNTIYSCGKIVTNYQNIESNDLYAFLKFYPTQAIDDKGLVWTWYDYSESTDGSEVGFDFNTYDGGTYIAQSSPSTIYTQAVTDNEGTHLAEVTSINNTMVQRNVWQDYLGADFTGQELPDGASQNIVSTWWYNTGTDENPDYQQLTNIPNVQGVLVHITGTTYKLYYLSNDTWTYTNVTISAWSSNIKNITIGGTTIYYKKVGNVINGPFYSVSSNEYQVSRGLLNIENEPYEIIDERACDYDDIIFNSSSYLLNEMPDNIEDGYYYYQTFNTPSNKQIYDDYYIVEDELGNVIYRVLVDKDADNFDIKQAKVKGLNSNVNTLINAIQINPDEPSIILTAGAVSDISLKITNDRISFMHSYEEDNVKKAEEVAYMSGTNGGKLYIQDAEILETLQVRDFEITSSSEGDFIIRGAE